jgi:hypothetical protein
MDGSNQDKHGIVFGGKKEIDRNYSTAPRYHRKPIPRRWIGDHLITLGGRMAIVLVSLTVAIFFVLSALY